MSATRARVLVVDDEELLLDLARKTLERAGFAVVTARSGSEAIERFEALAAELDCVLLDLSMPGMDGHETLDELRRLRAEVPVILSSGLASGETRPNDGRAAGFLEKPYRPHELVACLEAVLERSGR